MKVLSLVLTLIIVSFSLSAEENRNFFPMGEKELFSGNTGTAGIGSTAASYFNPGALTQIKHNKISVSASAFYYSSFKRTPTTQINGTNFNYEATSFNTVPSSINTVLKFGDWVGAFSIMVPFSQSYENQQVWNSATKNIYYEEKREESSLFIGLSGAKKLNSNWSVGFSLFAQKNYDLELVSMSMTSVVPDTEGELTSERVQSNIWSSSLILGFLYEDTFFDFGFKAQTPSVILSGKGDYYTSQISANNSGTYQETILNKKDVDVDYEIPADFSLGFNFHLTNSFDLLFDISYQLDGSYEEYSDPEIMSVLRENEVNENRVKYDAQYRVNIAFEYQPTDKIDLLGGIYYVPSSVPSGGEQMDGIGATFGGYFATQHSKSGLGVFALNMNGDHPVDGDTGAEVTRGETDFTIFGAVLSTSYNF